MRVFQNYYFLDRNLKTRASILPFVSWKFVFSSGGFTFTRTSEIYLRDIIPSKQTSDINFWDNYSVDNDSHAVTIFSTVIVIVVVVVAVTLIHSS